jgi:hypothetical protein
LSKESFPDEVLVQAREESVEIFFVILVESIVLVVLVLVISPVR